jgi:hypothetical protein
LANTLRDSPLDLLKELNDQYELLLPSLRLKVPFDPPGAW